MKLRFISAAILSLFMAATTFAQMGDKDKRPSPPATTKLTLNKLNVTIDYSQPSVKGREIFGDLVPYGKVWRTGANEATTITFNQAATVNGQKVEAGTYALFTIPGKDKWTVILNSDAKQWGAYKYKDDKNVATFEVKPTEHAMTEMMTFTADGEGNIMLDWATTRVSFTVK